MKEKVDKKYIVFDRVHNKISFSDELSTKPNPPFNCRSHLEGYLA